jgi:hypothetical protein
MQEKNGGKGGEKRSGRCRFCGGRLATVLVLFFCLHLSASNNAADKRLMFESCFADEIRRHQKNGVKKMIADEVNAFEHSHAINDGPTPPNVPKKHGEDAAVIGHPRSAR